MSLEPALGRVSLSQRFRTMRVMAPESILRFCRCALLGVPNRSTPEKRRIASSQGGASSTGGNAIEIRSATRGAEYQSTKIFLAFNGKE